ncbi:nitrate reductase subunit alpha [Actinopolymorpha sp. B9G3]|uniref:nitrate reductase subunit alpha n=1 Tax=Actinopolymorpha sp. B9G3 TaxID=3158970 RepID=UPI0032D94EC4
MTDGRTVPAHRGTDGSTAHRGGTDGPAADALLRAGRFFTRRETSPDLRAVYRAGGREGDVFYRDRWSHDKVVRSTHGVNCTGSCSWKVYVKDGIITWESQQTDYPSVGPDSPEYEPRGCPRGAAFSWYTYSPTRVRFPYARGVLVELYREANARLGDPVRAWAEVVGDPERRRQYQRARGKGGHVRVSWDEAVEMVAAAHVHTIKAYGPDRIAGFSPIPAMSMVSHAIGSRFIELIGGVMTSFYDWYADLPVASPQVFGDQTDVPESGDWWNAAYLLMWGSNVPVTRTPDAHWMAEARYRGQKVVVVSPDYADNTKFADTWLPAQPGTDGALAMALGHVILRECFVERRVPFFVDFVQHYTDLPFLVTLKGRRGGYVPDKLLRASDLGGHPAADIEGAEWRTVLIDGRTNEPVVPNGTLGDRWTDAGAGRWNLDLDGVTPRLTLLGDGADNVEVLLPRFDLETNTDTADGPERAEGRQSGVLRRGVPTRRVGGRLVTTVFDLMLAQYGVHRDGLPGVWPTGYDDASQPYTPAWQEPLTSVPARTATRVAREMARSAEKSGGRTMIIMGAGVCQWFHGDATYRAMLALLLLTGAMGRNGGGWAHYVGQEKCRPVTGWAALAGATDWQRPPRQAIGTAYWYTHTDQWRYDGYRADALTSPLARGDLAGMHTADTLALSARLGWMPSHPQFDANPLDLADDAVKAGANVPAYVAEKLAAGDLRFACDDPDAPENWPRCLTLWRANLLGSSSKGNEYFLKHLLGTHSSLRAEETSPDLRPRDVTWRDEAPEGKLDLLLALDFRMTSSTLLADVVLPAATWYEKHDLSSTDMHPFVHAFTPAIDPPWETRSDFAAFTAIARRFSELAKTHLGVRKDVVATALQHDTPAETGQPGGVVRDWRAGGPAPVPGRTMPAFTVVERDYPAVADKLAALGPLTETLGLVTKGVTFQPDAEVEHLRKSCGVMLGGAGDGRPALDTDAKMAEAILALSATTNGRLAVQGFRAMERRVGKPLAHLAEGSEERRISFADTQAHPVPVITSPEWSGSETGGRRYAAFTTNVEEHKPWHTLTGRMHLFLDHDWMHEFGEALPIYRPPLDMPGLFGERQRADHEHSGEPRRADHEHSGERQRADHEHSGEPALGPDGQKQVVVRYLTPHSKWSIHSEYQDNLLMLSLSRGGPTVWMSRADADAIGVRDNDWVELVNRNGVMALRAIVTHRMPTGTVFVYHAQERVVNVPIAEASGRRGGIHNSLTRILIKPTHLIGGYAQLSFAFNYLGPTGNQRDEVTVVRRRSQEVTY